ncbi:serine/threonine-protein kinase Nek1 isoform X6 [Carassius gibelio]|uniref:serine/threonine-protein kinase Nek1 isoform X6 n=1 Tax=Carassius gibelio TaxID=101364 RepID=UPI002279877E|nr:serine/threonine-protein kinase Nek1 isoform X6 [Carassius gibelio]XP_052442744.1 serine/threonine-protein kinase Nek1 isoform X6 [Carassius gibelio]
MDKYERLKKIGEGSFGKAILVKSRTDGRQYVIKEIGISRMSNKERQESRKEVAVLANMSHPNIVQYKESFEESGCLYIVMDYCEGGDLFKKINNQRGTLFPEEQILDWLVQICLALKHVHDRKILHRDIKSQNIFLTKDGTIQLGDFGIARVLNSTVELARTCIGTPYYLSPEICENKPYNNKSDIWALGCVLYEMCTLKHAFEAGNMKNLVLKIIRGSYPPVSVHYSQDLRSLLAQLFKRNPRERPSVSAILDKPFLARRIQKFLSPQIIAQEFSHSLHLHQPKMSVAQGAPAKRPAPGPIPISPAQKITKPAAKYGVPLTVRRPSDAIRKVPDAAKKPVKLKQAPPPAAAQRRVSRVEEERRKHEEGVRKKRVEMMERERKQREQMLLLKAAQMKRFEREKLNRINRAREQGWRHVLSSSGGSSPERKFYGGGGGGIGAPYSPGIGPSPVPGPTHAPALAPSRAPYDHVHTAAEKPSKPPPKDGAGEGAKSSGDNASTAIDSGSLNGHACIPLKDVVRKEPRKASLQNEQISKNDYAHRFRGQMVAERGKQVEEFLQRKREAMLNKVRAEGQLEYLARLRQIRLQNFNERQQIKARLRGEKYDSDGSDSQESCEEAVLRRKKIEALKAQSKARAAVIKEQLEKKRREAYEREKKAWEDHLVARGVKVAVGAVGGAPPPAAPATQPSDSTPQEEASKATPSSRPTSPVISMTAALKDVGAISSGQSSPMKEDSLKAETSGVQSDKKEILHRLNQKIQTTEEEAVKDATPCSIAPCPTPQQIQPSITEERSPAAGDRRKWEAVAPPILSVAEQTLDETCGTLAVSQVASPETNAPSGGDRKKWQTEGAPLLSVAQQTLEETSFTTAGQLTEKTAGEVICMEEGLRKAWGRSPDSEVLKVLEEAELQPFTQKLDPASTCDHTLTESLNLIEEPLDVTHEAKEVPLPQPCQPAIGLAKQEVTCQETVPITAEVKSQELILQTTEEIQKTPCGESETEVVDDMESVVLDEASQQTSKPPPADVMQAWTNDTAVSPPADGRVIQAECTEMMQREEKHPEPADESLFVKLSSSPAHKRAVALAILSAQSSLEDSSSVASRSRSVSPLRSQRHGDALLIGLSTGLFDTNNPKMLRTCSLPDLSKLFSDAAEPEVAVAPDSSLEIEDLEDKVDEHSETEDVYEDDDLRELRASMERLLQEQHSDDEDDDEEDDDGGGSNSSPADEEAAGLNGLASGGVDKCSPEEECFNGMAEEDDDVSHGEEEPGGPVTNGMEVEEDEEQNSSEGQLNEEWQSDDSEKEDEEDLEQQDSIFSRLEELRFHLEQAMGFENFILAYNKIKAIHEDEDENIAMGSSMVQSILGTKHQHLYPKILHLVMADGAYQEDNDE